MAFEGPVQNNCCMHLWNSRNDPDFCDVTFVVGKEETEFDANKTIVASCSPVLKNLLFWCFEKDESKEPNQQVKLQQSDPIAFEAMLKFAYCINPGLQPNNVIKVRKMAQKYGITRNETVLSKLCDEYVTQNISVSNCCLLFDEAVKSKMSTCIQTVQKLMEQNQLAGNAHAIVFSKGFCHMSLEAMQLFLQLDCLQMSEEKLWEAVLRWVAYQARSQLNDDNASLNDSTEIESVQVRDKTMESRKKLLQQICPFVRFGLMTANYFVTKVKEENCLTTKDIADILCYIADANQSCGKFTTKSRISALSARSGELYCVDCGCSSYDDAPCGD
eukprot:197181_1